MANGWGELQNAIFYAPDAESPPLLANQAYAGSYIYFVKAETVDAIKVGTARNVKARLAGMQTGSPLKLAIERTFIVPHERAYVIERRIHDALSGFRRHGEWFNVSADQATPIAELAILDNLSEQVQRYALMIRLYMDRARGRCINELPGNANSP